ncbi:hypothetical protein JCM10207_001782 [Rhodosporidiobolus poonsookiae]
MADTVPAAAAPPAHPTEKNISDEEAALYDRQIRLWGAAAQSRLQAARVLLAGRFRGIAVDTAKNVVLAGVGSLTLLDGEELLVEDLGSNYFARVEEVGQKRVEASAPRVQALNPRVNLSTETDASKLFSEEFLSAFDLVVVTDVDAPTVLKLNNLTRKLGKKFFAAGSIGMDGWMFADLLEHEYIVDIHKALQPGETTPVIVPTKSTATYVPFSLALDSKLEKVRKRELKRLGASFWATLSLFAAQRDLDPSPALPTATTVSEEQLKKAADKLLPTLNAPADALPEAEISRLALVQAAEFPPSCAIVGGLLGQDILNCVGGKEEPLRNFTVYEGATGQMRVSQLGL